MRRSHVLAAALGASQIAYGLEAPRPPWMTRGIVALLLTTSTADAIEQRGARGAAVVAAAGSVGFGAELLGVHTGRPFGSYGYSEQLGPQIHEVPLLAGAAWGLLARPSRVAGDWASRALPGERSPLGQRATRVLAAATALTAWDVFLDPRMVREGYWHWPEGGWYEGIPWTNYAGWWATGVVAFGAAELIDPHDDPAAPPAASAPSAIGDERSGDTALGLYAWTWIGELIANVLLWKRPKVAVAGGLSMAAIALPALARRVLAARA
ncbi:MAG: carotenoid biosynthesis protein [Solirubrobacteraceae bacterium]|nr:carotenoid biosynthesis protein [Solirubrobacteraceae bacterium]